VRAGGYDSTVPAEVTVTTAPTTEDPAPSKGPPLRPGVVLLLAAGMACFGSATPVSAIVGRHLPVWMGSFLRLLVASLALGVGVVVVRRDRPHSIIEELRQTTRADRIRLVVMAAVGTFGFSALMLLGMRHAPGTVAAIVMATTPAVTAAGAVLVLHERLTRWQVMALSLAVTGVLVVNFGSGTGHGSGDVVLLGTSLVFAAVCCEAVYSLAGKQLTGDLTPLTISLVAAVVATALFTPFAIWDAVHMSWTEPTVGDWVAVVWWGAGTFALGSWLWLEGMSRTSGATASSFMAVMPVTAMVLSYVLLGESFRWIQVVGMGLVLVGLVAVARSGSTAH